MRGVDPEQVEIAADALRRASDTARKRKRCRSTQIKNSKALSTCSHMLNHLLSASIITDLTSFPHAKAATASACTRTQSESRRRALSLADWSGGNCCDERSLYLLRRFSSEGWREKRKSSKDRFCT